MWGGGGGGYYILYIHVCTHDSVTIPIISYHSNIRIRTTFTCVHTFVHNYRVSLKTFSRVLWQTTVHKWEVDLYQDMVLRGNVADRDTVAASRSGRSHSDGGDGCDGGERGGGLGRREGRKRRAGDWEGEEERERERMPSKRRKASKLYVHV